MSRRRLITAASIGAVALIVLAATSETVRVGLCRWLDVGEAPQCADYVFLLPGEESYRPITAAALVKGGWANEVLIPETYYEADVKDGLRPSTASLLADILRDRGILETKIVCLPSASRTTFDDARALLTFLNTQPNGRTIVVTNAYHTRRARFIFRRVFGSEAECLQFVSAPNPGFTEGTWWQNRFSTNAILSENLKLAFYVIRYSRPYDWGGSVLLILLLWACSRDLRKALTKAGGAIRLEGDLSGSASRDGIKAVRRDAR